jgi:hypothetical protein
VPPESKPGLDPGLCHATALEHDGVHSLADALSPVLIQAVRDTPPEIGDNERTPHRRIAAAVLVASLVVLVPVTAGDLSQQDTRGSTSG